MNIRFDCTGACYAKEYRHPQKIMIDLGITYKKSTPHPIGDCWIFEDCDDLPEKITEYLTLM